MSSHKTDTPEVDVLDALIRTAHYMKREFESRLSSMDIPPFLTGPRLRLLVAVAQNEPVRMSDLAAIMDIKAITVTQFVDALEKEHLLVRFPDPKDRRATLIKLTDQAPALIQRGLSAAAKVKEELLEPLPMELRKQLIDILSQLVDFKKICIFDTKVQHSDAIE
ncbi:MarR family winged helix-turn-helix transcriptional regulator [Alicyclobacillus macrosporangiidus]|uniref:DNA-binding transcriptional regulator, MarR family n=1 Tax=Alicyclobacillus macrosporangiidus TaxID=392015 RepID=A0A1I7LHX6_9BACL|nr:MarR family transcriptional regulator [Alicyclobacillus macrosporangiidus]SFV09238.1 DNA-binding transcriptional regulator, MarR family [Alicyclobacillus macrosporangiidus]